MSDQITSGLSGRLHRLIETRLGLRIPSARVTELLVTQLATHPLTAAASVEAWITQLEVADMFHDAFQSLVRDLTVSETYFFREPKQCHALQTTILPELIHRRRRAGTRELRIWSAGCCTGEEAYTLAMILEQLLPDIDEWKIHILGTDVNLDYLRRAEAGVFPEWSFRSTCPTWIKERYFRATPNGNYALSERTRQRVTFVPYNLAAPRPAPVLQHPRGFDLILFRNVMLYFTPHDTQAVLTKLLSLLAEDGALALSSTEHAAHTIPLGHSEQINGAFFYRKSGSQAPALSPTKTSSQDVARRGAEVQTPLPIPQRNAPAPRLREMPPSPESPTLKAFAQARDAANAGKLEHALALCTDALGDDKLDARLHQLRAKILVELHRLDEASNALRSALYLSPDSIYGHFTLGSLALRQRRPAEARRCFSNVLALLASIGPETPVPEMEGLTAGHLLAIVHSLTTSAA